MTAFLEISNVQDNVKDKPGIQPTRQMKACVV